MGAASVYIDMQGALVRVPGIFRYFDVCGRRKEFFIVTPPCLYSSAWCCLTICSATALNLSIRGVVGTGFITCTHAVTDERIT